MANIHALDFNKKLLSSGNKPQGYNESYQDKQALASGDKLYLGIIPGGVEINGVSLINGADADATLSLGFEPVDPSSSLAANLTAWFSGQALSVATRKESQALPIKFNEDVKLVATIGGGAFPADTGITIITAGKGVGIA